MGPDQLASVDLLSFSKEGQNFSKRFPAFIRLNMVLNFLFEVCSMMPNLSPLLLPRNPHNQIIWISVSEGNVCVLSCHFVFTMYGRCSKILNTSCLPKSHLDKQHRPRSDCF